MNLPNTQFRGSHKFQIMWAASPNPPSPFSRRLPIPTRPVSVIYAKSQPPKSDADNTTPSDSSSSIKSFGHKILSAVNSPNPNRKQTTPKQESQISGSDVLRALQKAAAVKEKNRPRQVKEKQKVGPSTEGIDSQNSDMNRRVRPLRINSDWGLRLTELEKRLQDISDMV